MFAGTECLLESVSVPVSLVVVYKLQEMIGWSSYDYGVPYLALLTSSLLIVEETGYDARLVKRACPFCITILSVYYIPVHNM